LLNKCLILLYGNREIRLVLNKQLKAYCGDGLLRSILGELYRYNMFNLDSFKRLESNKHLALCWADLSGWSRPHLFGKARSHTLGTNYESMIYETFTEVGYDAARTWLSTL